MSENNQVESKAILKKRLIGCYKYIKCPTCYHEIEIDKSKETFISYCNNCNGIILDLAQNYCCWCGGQFK